VTVTTALHRRSNLHVVPSPAAPSPLIERAVELDVLRSSVARLESGASGVVVLEAPAGLGKTYEIRSRRFRINHRSQRRRVWRDDHIFTQAAFEAQARHAKIRVLVGEIQIASVVSRF